MAKQVWGVTGAIIFDFSDLERSMSMSLLFQRLISRKGAKLGYVLLIKDQ